MQKQAERSETGWRWRGTPCMGGGEKILVWRGGNPLTGFIRAISCGPLRVASDGRPNYWIYAVISSWSRRVSAGNDSFFRKRTVQNGCADRYQHNRSLLMVSLFFHAKYKRFIATIDSNGLRVPRAVSIVLSYNRHNVITWLVHFIVLYRYYIADNNVNNVADSEILRDNVEFRWKIIWIWKMNWPIVCVTSHLI